MADALEKSILDGSFFRGPRTPSPTRSASTASNSGSDDEGSEEEEIPSRMPATQRRTTSGRSTNTGPKGVIADRNAARELAKEEQRQSINETNERLRRLALVGNSTGELSDGDEDDEEEREVLGRYRSARLAEMQGAQSQHHQFGHLVEIDNDRQYLSAIEDEDDEDRDGHVVVVHIYSRALQRCNHLTSSLSSLARQRPTTKFIQVQADVIDFGGGDHDVLPTILVYKHGDLVANLVRIDLDQQWGKGEERDVERVIKSHGAFT